MIKSLQRRLQAFLLRYVRLEVLLYLNPLAFSMVSGILGDISIN
jgi:hypothetical protein